MFQNKRLKFTAALLLLSLLLPDIANATPLNRAGVRLGRLGISASIGNDLLVTFRLNNTPTSVSKIKISLPSGFTVTTGTPVVGSTFPNTPASITAPPGLPGTATATGGGAGTGGTIVVSGLTSASLDNTTLYGFTVATGTVQNPATAGQYILSVESENAASTPIDSLSTPTYIYGVSANQDQIAVSASVAPNFSFALSANSDTVPQIDPTTIQTSTGVTMTVGTNSPLGYTAYVKSANAALTSATSPGTPISTGTFNAAPDSITPGTTKYGLVPATGPACSTCTGSLTYDAEFLVVDGTHAGSFNGANFASFVSRSGYTNSDQITLRERATVANTVGYANDYSDTLTIVAAGNF